MMDMESNTPKDNLVFYDGDCGFCNSSVQFILAKKKWAFYFSPLQSISAEKILQKHKVKIQLDTIYFLRKGKLYNRSSAALQIARGLKGGYPLLFIFYGVPKFLRDPVYNLIARNRHRIRAGYCMIPLPEDEQYFLKD